MKIVKSILLIGSILLSLLVINCGLTKAIEETADAAAASTPNVTSITPGKPRLYMNQAETVTITGENFTNSSYVIISQVTETYKMSCTVQYDSSTQIVITIPATGVSIDNDLSASHYNYTAYYLYVYNDTTHYDYYIGESIKLYAPQPPTDFVITAGDTGGVLNATWTPFLNNSSYSVRLKYYKGSSSSLAEYAFISDSTGAQLTELIDGNWYTIRINSCYSDGEDTSYGGDTFVYVDLWDRMSYRLNVKIDIANETAIVGHAIKIGLFETSTLSGTAVTPVTNSLKQVNYDDTTNKKYTQTSFTLSDYYLIPSSDISGTGIYQLVYFYDANDDGKLDISTETYLILQNAKSTSSDYNEIVKMRSNSSTYSYASWIFRYPGSSSWSWEEFSDYNADASSSSHRKVWQKDPSADGI